MKKNILVYGFVLGVLLFTVKANATIRYVKTGSAGTAPYTSWATASNDLQAVINQCIAGDEIWIATGTYKPNRRADALTVITATDRNDAFVLKNAVKIYGGFTGVETLLSQRNSTANVATLSGDIGTAGVTTDNCYHVVIIANTASTTTLMDGVSIVSGNANAAALIPSITVNTFSINPRFGGGMYKVSSGADITDCKFRRNDASLSGAGIYETLSTVASVYTNCTVTQNVSADDGGGMYIVTSGCLYQTCSFTSNDAADKGAGIYISGTGSPAFTDCIISSNDAGGEGGAAYLTGSGSPDFEDCTINSNTAGSNGGGITNRTTGTVSFFKTIFTGNISGADGGAMYNNTAAVSIFSCQINGNEADGNGGGISNVDSDADIHSCRFENNTSLTAIGGGVHHSGGYLLTTNTVYSGNQAAATSALYLNNNDAIIMDCLFSGNKSTGGRPAINLQLSNTVTITGCTITGNKKQTGITGSGIEIGSGCVLTLNNSILWGNQGTTPGASPIALAGGTITATYNLIEAGYAGTGNISTNPLFTNPIAATAAPTITGNYRLQKCSPAINTGNNAAVVPPGSFADLDLNPRLDYSNVDMGAYEKHLAVPDANGIVYVDSSNILNEGDGSSWDKAITQVADVLKEAYLNNSISQVWVAKGTYKPLYIPNGDFSLISCPATNRDNTFLLVNNVKVYGGFAGGETDTSGRNFVTNETILNGDIGVANDNTDNCYHVVISSGAAGSAALNGFTVINGNADGGTSINVNGQAIRKDNGGGMNNTYSSPAVTNCIISGNGSSGNGAGINNSFASPTITNCTISNNGLSLSGGGIYNSSSSPIVTNCTISGNSAFEGGGIYNTLSSPSLTNCIISGNKTSTNGGGIYNYSTSNPVIINTTIAGNKADFYGGGIYNSTSTPVLKNSIMWGNMSVLAYTFAGVVSNCIINGSHAGVGNYDIDPLFVNPQAPANAPTTLGDYHLQACSPAINMGDNSLIVAGVTKDIDSLGRIMFTTVDMGAYEKQDVDLSNSTWKGVNTNWNDKINWCGGYIPYDTTNVIVPLTTNKPLIGAGFDNQVKNISFANGTSIGIAATSKFTINGTYSNLGSAITNNGDWVMAGNAASQTFPGTLATVSAMNNLEVNNTSGLKFDKSFQLTGTLTPTAGNINVDNATVTLNSDATSTARVAVVPATVAFSYTGTGRFEIERYIPPHRAWRLLTAPLGTATNLTISQAWQEGLSNSNRLSPIIGTAGFGTTITKSTTYSAADGYDQGSTNSPSIRYYNGSNWGGVPTKTIGTTVGGNDGLINDQQGYMLFVRGDRGIVVAGTGVAATVTTLRPKGQLKVGPQTIVCNGWTVIGNPYASPINFHKIVLDNPGLPDAFYVWDANLAGSYNVGGWVSYGSYNGGSQTYTVAPLLSGSTFANNKGDISSGSAFVVNYTGTISINENHKSTQGDNVLLRPLRQLSMNLFVVNADSTESLNDGVAIVMDASPRAACAEKNTNFTENLAIAFNNKRYAIQNRQLPHFNDTIFMYTGQMKQRNYVLEIKAAELNVPNRMKAYLEDTYLHQYTTVALEGSTRYAFSVNADSASLSAARFRLLFKRSGRFGHINATAKENDIEVLWQMEETFGIKQYEIERSINGIDFTLVQNQPTNRNQQPLLQNQWLDVSPATGTYYYRIKAIAIDGEVLYSDIAKAAMVKNNEGMYVYPNPVTGNSLQLRMNKQLPGQYSATLINQQGLKIFTQQWQHSGGFVTRVFELPGITASGIYQLEITKPDGKREIISVELSR